MKKIYALIAILMVAACSQVYSTPPRSVWDNLLGGASFGVMSETAKVAKRPLYIESGGKILKPELATEYMAKIEFALGENLRQPGIQIQRVGRDVLAVIIRDVFMQDDAPEISDNGAVVLGRLANILREYNMTFVEITGYADNSPNIENNQALSFDMAERLSVFLAQNKINTYRLFVQGRGASRPIAEQNTELGRRTNRRVEIRISPAL
ncbi:MAG: OmpA family protein [Rickettsiales bacterium]|jgi:outer membrane protein OmpA-like peptidoglycan-associated protein|nr:OmpA family protein [Rickettsiales bacterium]